MKKILLIVFLVLNVFYEASCAEPQNKSAEPTLVPASKTPGAFTSTPTPVPTVKPTPVSTPKPTPKPTPPPKIFKNTNQYINKTYRFVIEYPTYFNHKVNMGNSNILSVVNYEKNIDLYITVNKNTHVQEKSLEKLYKSVCDDKPDAFDKQKSDNWFAMKWMDYSMIPSIVYFKSYWYKNYNICFQLQFPEEESDKYMEVVTIFNKSFRFY